MEMTQSDIGVLVPPDRDEVRRNTFTLPLELETAIDYRNRDLDTVVE
jgi:hypothetical protein